MKQVEIGDNFIANLIEMLINSLMASFSGKAYAPLVIALIAWAVVVWGSGLWKLIGVAIAVPTSVVAVILGFEQFVAYIGTTANLVFVILGAVAGLVVGGLVGWLFEAPILGVVLFFVLLVVIPVAMSALGITIIGS